MEFRNIDFNNFDEIIDLVVNDEQKEFVATNLESLAEAYVAQNALKAKVLPFGLYENNILVGFIMIGYNVVDESDPNDPQIAKDNYLLWRFMIDKRYQNKGFGRKALEKAIELVKIFPSGKAKYFWTSYEPENIIAKKLYHSLGFVDTGEKNGNENISRLKL